MNWHSLSKRERLLIGLGLPLLAVIAGYRLIWLPMAAERAALLQEISSYRQIVEMELATRGMTAAAAEAPQDATPLAVRATRSAEAFGLPLSRIEPEGDGLRLSVDTAGFNAVLDWVQHMERAESLRLRAIDLDRRPEPGTVSARLALEAM